MSAVREKVTCWEWAFAPAQRPVGRDGGEWARISGANCSLPPYTIYTFLHTSVVGVRGQSGNATKCPRVSLSFASP